MWQSMLLSFALQLIAVTVGIVISILTVDKLGAFSLPQPMPPVPRSPKPIHIIAVKQYHSSASSSALHTPVRPFVVPARIPEGVPVILDGPEMQLAQLVPFANTAGSIVGAVGLESGVSHAGPTKLAPPPPPQPKEPREQKQVMRIGGNVLEAKLVKRVMPVYPTLARQMRLSGVVHLEGVIARDGRVVNLQVVSGHPMLVAAALEAVRQWIYRPTLLNGESVEVIAPIDVRFILSQ